MYIENCSLGCSSGVAGAQVSCALTQAYVNQEIRVRFSRPVDPASVSVLSFLILNVNTGQIAVGAHLVDPLDAQAVIFRPSLNFDAGGNPIFGFEANAVYRIQFAGVAQGDSGPFVQSTDVPALDNQSRMQCDIAVTLGIALPQGSVPYCFGVSNCPCGNNGAAGRGCANSTSANGLGLEAVGAASVGNDSLLLYLHGVPPGPVAYFQGTLRENGGLGTAFGDGLFCAGGNNVRLKSNFAIGPLQAIPAAGHPPISTQGQVPAAGGTRTYQAWYRDLGSFCTGATFNWTNGIEIAWVP